MMWVSVVRIEADEDPGAELVTVLKDQFGEAVRTQTKAAWLYEAERAPVEPVQSVRPLRDTRQRKLA